MQKRDLFSCFAQNVHCFSKRIWDDRKESCEFLNELFLFRGICSKLLSDTMDVWNIQYSGVIRMGLWCLVGFLTAFGIGCAAVVLALWFFYRGASGEVVCFGTPEDRIILASALAHLRKIGLLRCRILVLSENLLPVECWVLSDSEIELIDREQLARCWIGAEKNDGTGNGYPAGHDLCSDLPEL